MTHQRALSFFRCIRCKNKHTRDKKIQCIPYLLHFQIVLFGVHFEFVFIGMVLAHFWQTLKRMCRNKQSLLCATLSMETQAQRNKYFLMEACYFRL